MVNGVMMRKCPACGKVLPVHRFYPKTVHHPNGKTYYTRDSWCDICKSRKGREYRKKIRASPDNNENKKEKSNNKIQIR